MTNCNSCNNEQLGVGGNCFSCTKMSVEEKVKYEGDSDIQCPHWEEDEHARRV